MAQQVYGEIRLTLALWADNPIFALGILQDIDVRGAIPVTDEVIELLQSLISRVSALGKDERETLDQAIGVLHRCLELREAFHRDRGELREERVLTVERVERVFDSQINTVLERVMEYTKRRVDQLEQQLMDMQSGEMDYVQDLGNAYCVTGRNERRHPSYRPFDFSRPYIEPYPGTPDGYPNPGHAYPGPSTSPGFYSFSGPRPHVPLDAQAAAILHSPQPYPSISPNSATNRTPHTPLRLLPGPSPSYSLPLPSFSPNSPVYQPPSPLARESRSEAPTPPPGLMPPPPSQRRKRIDDVNGEFEERALKRARIPKAGPSRSTYDEFEIQHPRPISFGYSSIFSVAQLEESVSASHLRPVPSRNRPRPALAPIVTKLGLPTPGLVPSFPLPGVYYPVLPEPSASLAPRSVSPDPSLREITPTPINRDVFGSSPLGSLVNPRGPTPRSEIASLVSPDTPTRPQADTPRIKSESGSEDESESGTGTVKSETGEIETGTETGTEPGTETGTGTGSDRETETPEVEVEPEPEAEPATPIIKSEPVTPTQWQPTPQKVR